LLKYSLKTRRLGKHWVSCWGVHKRAKILTENDAGRQSTADRWLMKTHHPRCTISFMFSCLLKCIWNANRPYAWRFVVLWLAVTTTTKILCENTFARTGKATWLAGVWRHHQPITSVLFLFAECEYRHREPWKTHTNEANSELFYSILCEYL
jgi:hypothetical protein